MAVVALDGRVRREFCDDSVLFVSYDETKDITVFGMDPSRLELRLI